MLVINECGINNEWILQALKISVDLWTQASLAEPAAIERFCCCALWCMSALGELKKWIMRPSQGSWMQCKHGWWSWLAFIPSLLLLWWCFTLQCTSGYSKGACTEVTGSSNKNKKYFTAFFAVFFFIFIILEPTVPKFELKKTITESMSAVYISVHQFGFLSACDRPS